MSARSRALADLAVHFERLRDGTDGPNAWKVYNGFDVWDKAADMARRTALEERWRERLARLLHLPWP